MRDDILRQAVLAIAVSIDYKADEYTKRVPPGTDLRQLEDPAFFILRNELLSRFKDAWEHGVSGERTSDGKPLPPLRDIYTSSRILSGLIHYVALELSWSVYRIPAEMTAKMLESSYHVIVQRFIHSEQGDMLTELASRECVYEAIRNHLIKSNFRTDAKIMNMLLHSNRPQIVFNMFKEYFREHSATAFRFEGSYIDFIMNAYQNYFYANHKADIWRAFGAVDSAKREIEMDFHTVRYLDQGGAPADMYVHEHLINIGEANVELFSHSGHKKEANGVMYDAYYLALCHLCELYARRINEKLDGFCIEFKDPYSRLEGAEGNKGIGAKISNAKQVVQMMFDYTRSGNFNVSRLLDFRRECFRLGRGDTQSTNPVWKSMGENNSGEAARYLDTEDGITNYITFEIVFKAVASIYTLMRALEERGRDLVTEYIKGRPDPLPDGTQSPFSDWFINDNIYRYMDYLSSLDYLPLMRKLQAESTLGSSAKQALTGKVDPNASEDLGAGDLHNFEEMIYLYAGSQKNTNSNINENRRYATTHGLLNKPKLKERDPLTTSFERKRSVFSYMTAIPYSCMEVDARRKKDYEAAQRQAQVQDVYALFEFPTIPVDYRGSEAINMRHVLFNSNSGYTDYATELYKGLHYNSVLGRNPSYVSQHVASAATKGSMDSLDWHIGTSEFPCLLTLTPDQTGRQMTEKGLQQKWYTRLYLHIPMLETCITTYSGVLPGEEIPMVVWSDVPFNGESAWVVEGRGFRRYACSPFTNDLHSLCLAAGLAPDAQNLYVPAEQMRKMYSRAKEMLESSLGFALYIGVENLGKPEIEADILSKIPVYQDYKGQVSLYRQWLVELSWMQEDFVQVLQLMYSFCWCMSLPEFARNPRDIKHARSLFNSLLTHVFNKEDLDWFFAMLRLGYYDVSGTLHQQHIWPRRIVDFSTNKSAEGRRAPIVPRWALTLRGSLGSLVDDVGLKPPTNFEAGPYEQFMTKAQGWSDVSERFVLLHAFLYEKTRYIKLLRDAYTLTFGFLPEDNNTLSCELNSVLKVMQVFDVNDPAWVNEVAVMIGMGDASGDFVREQVLRDNKDFAVLLNALSGYYDECVENLRTLVNYDVAVDSELVSKFDKWHDALVMIPPITSSDILTQIRGQYVCDEHKYFYAGTGYFKADYGGNTLYLHYSGHFLKATKDGQYEAFVLYRDGDTSQKLYEYEAVLKKVIASVRYSDYE